MGITHSHSKGKKNYHLCDLGLKNIADLSKYVSERKTILSNKVTHLTLWNNSIKTISSEIFELLGNLNSLDLSMNKFEKLPDELFDCIKLFELRISFNTLTKLPPRIGELSNLTDLEMQACRLKKLPKEIALLKNLVRLDIRSNLLEELGDPIAELINLNILRAGCNLITSITEHITNIENLQIFGLKMNALEQLPSEFGFSQLESLDLSINMLKELPPSITACTRLTELNVSQNQLTILVDLQNFAYLHTLNVSDNNLSSLPSDLSYLSDLRKFDANENRIIEIPDSLESLQWLEHIGLRNNRITELPHSLGTLPNLKSLELSFNLIEEIPSSIGQLKKIIYMHLDGNKFTNLPESLSNLTDIRVIGLSLNSLDDKAFENISFEGMKMLSDVRLSGNLLTKIPACISQLQGLQSLYIGYNNIESLDCKLSNSLQLLHAAGNKLTKFPPELLALTNVRYLWLNGNQMTEIPKKIGAMTSLIVLDLSENHLEGLPKTFGNLNNLTELCLSYNQLEKLPNCFDKLDYLTLVDLSYNPKLADLPKSLLALSGVRNIKLNHCNFSQLDNKHWSFSSACWVTLEGNPLQDFPEHLKAVVDIVRIGKRRRKQLDSITVPSVKHFYDVNVSEMQGSRPTMEDSFLIKENQAIIAGGRAFHLFSVFDGHVDSETAEFCASHFHIVLEECLEKVLGTKKNAKSQTKQQFIEKSNETSMESESLDDIDLVSTVKKGIKKAFYLMNTKIDEEHLSSGCTVALALICNEHMWTTSCGDARVTIGYADGTAARVTTDHKATNLLERRRVHEIGGYVTENGRVVNRIAIARSLGDREFQPYVSCEPETTYHVIDKNIHHVIIACDGLWDVISDEQAVSFVHEYAKKKSTIVGSATYLRDLAFLAGSSDNISTLVFGLKVPDGN